MKKLINTLLIVKNVNRNIFEVILWWELRRILYNLIALISGAISMGIISLLVNLKPGEDLEEPLMILFFGLVCNVAYTFGWITEIVEPKSISYGPRVFKLGLLFTLVIIFLPAVVHTGFWIGRGFIKMN